MLYQLNRLQSKKTSISIIFIKTLAKISCPRCQRKVDSQAITCPYCSTELKAFGHPGMTLHRAKGDEYLCDTCTYHIDNSCTYPKRPYAKDCTLYQNIQEYEAQKQQQIQQSNFNNSLKGWIGRNQTLLLFVALFLVCLLIAISTSG